MKRQMPLAFFLFIQIIWRKIFHSRTFSARTLAQIRCNLVRRSCVWVLNARQRPLKHIGPRLTLSHSLTSSRLCSHWFSFSTTLTRYFMVALENWSRGCWWFFFALTLWLLFVNFHHFASFSNIMPFHLISMSMCLFGRRKFRFKKKISIYLLIDFMIFAYVYFHCRIAVVVVFFSVVEFCGLISMLSASFHHWTLSQSE